MRECIWIIRESNQCTVYGSYSIHCLNNWMLIKLWKQRKNQTTTINELTAIIASNSTISSENSKRQYRKKQLAKQEKNDTHKICVDWNSSVVPNVWHQQSHRQCASNEFQLEGSKYTPSTHTHTHIYRHRFGITDHFTYLWKLLRTAMKQVHSFRLSLRQIDITYIEKEDHTNLWKLLCSNKK